MTLKNTQISLFVVDPAGMSVSGSGYRALSFVTLEVSPEARVQLECANVNLPALAAVFDNCAKLARELSTKAQQEAQHGKD